MLYEIEQAVFERFPGYARMAVVTEGVDNTREIPELAELLAQCEEGVRRDDLEDFWHVPVLETWAEAFSGMGIKPKKNPPSVINLRQRFCRVKPLPFINPAGGDNCISLKCFFVAVRGDDRNVIEGDCASALRTVPKTMCRSASPTCWSTRSLAKSSTIRRRKMCSAGHGGRTQPSAVNDARKPRNAVINGRDAASVRPATAEQAAEEVAGLLHTHLEPRRPSAG